MKTLGIKFQVAGAPQAQASLDNLRTNINSALNQNKKAISNYQNDVKRSWSEWKIENFGTKSQKQNLIIRRDRRDFQKRSTYKGVSRDTRSQILETRFLFKEFLIDLKKLVKEDLKDTLQETFEEVSNKESSFEKITSTATAPFKAAAAGVLSPIEAMLFGGLQRIGEELVRDFAQGLSSQMQKNLGLQLKEVGQDIGGAIGSSMYLAYEKIMVATRNSVVDRHPVSGSNEALHITKLLDDFGQILQGFVLSMGAVPIKARKRIEMDKKAIPLVKEKAGELMINRKLTTAQEEEIGQSKSITVLTGGANYDEQAGTTDFAYRTLQPMLRGSYVHPVKNLFSNAQGTAEFDRIFSEMLSMGLNNDTAKAELLQFAKNNNSEELEEKITDEELEAMFTGDAAEVSQKITEFFKRIHIPLPKILEVVFKGYNPDDIAMAAEGIFFKEKYPDKPLQFVGTSFGGFNAAGSAEIMNRMGYEDVKAVGVTTPLIGMESTVDPNNYMSSIGDLDFLYEMTLGGVFEGKVPKPDNLQVVPGKGKGHLLGHFLAQSPEFRNFLQYFLKGRVDVPSMEEYSGKEVMAMGRIPGNNAESAIVRTIKKNLGEKHDDGYTFNQEDLISHRDHLVRLAGGADLRKIKNPQLKEFYSDYVQFLDTLAGELETIEKFKQVGKKFKPVNSLRQATNFYPDLGHLVPNHPDFEMSQAEFDATNREVEANKNLIAFKRKIDNESPNIERTYRAMLGEDITEQGYGYYDDEEYQVRANEHLPGLIGYLEDVVLKDASDSEKGSAAPYLELLKKLKQTILQVGDTGELSTAEIAEAEKLLGISLKEYKSILSKNETLNVKDRKGEIQAAAAKAKQGKQSKLVMDVKPELEAYIWAINQELIREGKEQIDVATTEYLGSGYKNHAIKANGKVYKFARHTNPLAAKVNKMMGKKKESYQGEIAALKKLQGENAPGFVAGGEEFMAMDEAEGVTLKEALETASPEERRELLKKSARLLKSFHKKGVAHLDFHPGNIIKQNDGNLVAIDWEAAKVTKDKKQHHYDREVAVSRFQDVLSGSMGVESSSDIEMMFDDAYHGNEDRVNSRQEAKRTQQEIIDHYNQHLNQTIERAAESAQQAINNDDVTIDADTAYDAIRDRIAEYRRAVEQGLFKQARSTGELILEATEYLKQVFNETGDSRKGQLTRIQNEIINGDAGAGRVNKPLSQLPYSPGQRQLSLDFEEIGQQSQQGFDNGADGRESGEKFASDVAEGTQDGLDINSPSRVFEWIGHMVRAGFNAGVSGIGDDLTESLFSQSADEYKKFLAQLDNEPDGELEFFVKKTLLDYGDLPEEDKAEYVQNSLKYKERAKRRNDSELDNYRSAVESNDLISAKEIATDLMGEINPLRKAYQQIVDSLGEDDDLARVTRSRIADMNSVETELSSLPALYQQQLNTRDAGGEVNNEFIEAIEQDLDSVRDVGEQIGSTVNEGIEDATADSDEIEGAVEEIADNVVSGIEDAGEQIADATSGVVGQVEEIAGEATEDASGNFLDGVAETVSNVAGELDDSEGLLDSLFETEGADKEVNDFFGGLVERVSDVFDSLTERFPILGRLADLFLDIGGELLQFFGLAAFSESLINFSNEALATAMEMESLEKSIVAVSRSASDGADNIRFIREEARRLSIDLVTAGESYKRILGATKNTPLEGLQTEQIFSTLATTAKNRGLNADATSRLFLGFEQAIAKGEFKSEEVRGQLAEVLGDIQNLLATSVGVPTSQLSELMEAGDLKVGEVMPKLVAQLNAQNAALGDSSGTAAAAQTRLNNAILEYQDAVGRQLQPVQKMGLNSLAAALEVLRNRASEIIKLIAGLFLTVLTNLILKLLATKLITFALSDAIYRLGFALGAIMPKLLMFAKRFVLITAAIEVWSNVIKLARSPLKDLDDRVERSAKRLEALRKAFENTGDAAKNSRLMSGKLPTQNVSMRFNRATYLSPTPELQLNEGMDLSEAPGWVKAIAGGDRLNLDNLVRNRLNKIYDFEDGNLIRYGPLGYFMKDGQTTTQAQRKQNVFVSGASEIIADSDSTLMRGAEAKKVLEEIAVLDATARDLESQRLNILPGDTEGLKAALEKEAEVQRERDLLLEKSSQYTESIQGQIIDINETLSELDELDKTGGSDEEVRARVNIRKSLEERLELLEDEKKAVDEINSRIPKFLSQVDRLLRNTDVQVRGFIANQDDDAIGARTEAISETIAEGLTDADLEVKLDNLTRSDLEDRIEFVQGKINSLESDLSNAYLTSGVTGLERAAEEQGLGELTTEAIEVLLEQGRTSAETKAGNLLIALDEYEGMVAIAQSELVDLVKTNRDRLRDNSRTIADYFFQINQQVKSAQIEVERVIDQIVNSQIKNQLQAALSPSADSFVNQLISSTQSLLDQAASYAERVLGQKSVRIQFATTERSLQMELQDFARNVGGASDALLEFEKRLRDDNSIGRLWSGKLPTENATVVTQSRTVNSSNGDDSSTGQSPDSFAGKTKQIANRLGIDPHALMTIMLFESAGTLNPKIQGPNVPGQGRGRGLIQFMPATARRLGTSDAELAGMTDIDQLDYVEKYFAQFKGNFGAGKLENLYAAVLAGNPLKVNASDGYTTARKGAKTMMKDFGDKANELLETSSNDEKVTAAYVGEASHSKRAFTGNKILVRRSGQKTPEGMEILRYDLVKDGQVVDSIINGYSGVKNKQKFNTPENHVAKTLTPPPDGTWKINLNQAGEVAAGKTNNDPNSAVGKYWVGLTPQFETGRSAIGLHLENQALGSAGCLVFTDPTSIKKLTSWARDNGISNLELDLATVADSPWTKGMSADSRTSKERADSPSKRRGSPEPALAVRAERSTKELIDKQEQKLDLEDLLIQNQERDALDIAIANNLKSDRRLVDFNIVDSQFALDKLLDAGKDLMSQYDFRGAADEAAKSIRAVNTAFSDRDLQISREIIKYTDEIKAINNLISQAPSEISMLRGFGMNDEADIITEKVAQAQLLLKPYEEILKSLFTEYENNLELAKSALKFTNEQNKLKEETERLNKRSLLLTQKSAVAEARGSVEQQRKANVAQEELRLRLRINELKQQNKPGEYLDSLVAGERRQSQINTENINYDHELQELDFEKKLLDMQSSSDNKNAEFLSTRGFNFESNKIKRDSAIAQENLRFERELVELRKQYANQPELLEEFTRAATELNRVNLRSIENEFKSLGKTIEDNFITSTQGFFSQFATEGISFVDQGQKERQLLEERLRYAEELVSLENQHKEEPGKLAHLKNRARELNEEKLDKIRSEFNLFSRTVDLAKQAVMEFVKQLAVMVAQRAAAKFLTSILGSAIGGAAGGGVSAVGNDYGSGAGMTAFVANEGITVGHRKVNDRNTSILRRNFSGVASSWNAEGKGAQLGVFHTGEELLSRKTGEAGRYQMLKREYGINPLDKVLNYSEGGTIPDVGSNILSGFSNTRNQIDLGAINSRPRSDAKAQAGTTVYLSETIYAQDADSFRLNEDQRNQDLVERLRRGI